MDLDWDDIRTIGELVRAGSLAGAGAALGVNYTTVARRVRRAEAALGEPLFERLADGYRPTEAARLVAEHATAMEDAQHGLMRRLAGRDGRLEGPLTITAPQLLIAHCIAPALEGFTGAFPGIELMVRASNDLLDLSRREADVALRISRAPGDALKGLRLAAQHAASFAAPVWAERMAADPEGPVDWIVYDQYPDLPSEVAAKWPGARVRYRFDDMVAILGAAQAGLGVARMPMFLGRAAGGLVQVPAMAPKPYADIWAIAHADVWPSARVRAFRDHIVPFIRRRRTLFVA